MISGLRRQKRRKIMGLIWRTQLDKDFWMERQKLMYREYETKHTKRKLKGANMFEGFDHSGAVGCVAIVSGSDHGGADLYIGNVGDCEAVLCRNGKGMLVSKKYSPSDQYEKERIE